jgi:hypothetical protein
VRFQYDPDKAAANLRKHGVSFADAEGVLEDPLALTVADPDAEGEERFISMGTSSAGELLVVVYANRGDACRIISARRATKAERRSYEG